MKQNSEPSEHLVARLIVCGSLKKIQIQKKLYIDALNYCIQCRDIFTKIFGKNCNEYVILLKRNGVLLENINDSSFLSIISLQKINEVDSAIHRKIIENSQNDNSSLFYMSPPARIGNSNLFFEEDALLSSKMYETLFTMFCADAEMHKVDILLDIPEGEYTDFAFIDMSSVIHYVPMLESVPD